MKFPLQIEISSELEIYVLPYPKRKGYTYLINVSILSFQRLLAFMTINYLITTVLHAENKDGV